jgi:hypothetical protein
MTNKENPQKPTQATAPNTNATYASSAPNKDPAVALHAEIKKTWSKLSDEDIKLHEKQPEQFFSKVKEKQNVSNEDAQKRLKEMKTSCGCGTSKAA